MAETFWIDTNIILRFLTQDQAEQSKESVDLMRAADEGKLELCVHPLVVAECCYVLEGISFKQSSWNISQWLSNFLVSEGIKATDKMLVLTALEIYGDTGVDFEDAYLATLTNNDTPTQLISFDQKDFKKLNIEFYRPREVISALEE